MSRDDAVALDESLDACDVSRAWLVWSSAAETALADAFRFAGGPVSDRGLVLGRGAARMHTVRLGGPLKRSIPRSAADAGEGDDVHLKRDSSAAPLLDLRRRLKAVMDVWDGIIRHGVSLSRSVELLLQWDRVFRLGPLGLRMIILLPGIVVWASLVGWWVIFLGYRILFIG